MMILMILIYFQKSPKSLYEWSKEGMYFKKKIFNFLNFELGGGGMGPRTNFELFQNFELGGGGVGVGALHPTLSPTHKPILNFQFQNFELGWWWG
jgi:hypothetical protein